MIENWPVGIVLILVAGIFQGTFMLPMKYSGRWKWENTWLLFSTIAYLILPWCLAMLTVPDLKEIFAKTTTATVGRTVLFGLGWGVGALTFGLGVDRLGLALGFAIILGLTASIGTLVPLMLLSPGRLLSPQGLLLLTGVALMLVGISVCSWAGNLKEDALSKSAKVDGAPAKRSFLLGLVLCVFSGILSPCGNLGFVFGSEMRSVAIQLGTPATYASNPFWAVITFPLFVCNGAFCIYMLVRKQSIGNFVLAHTGNQYWLAASMGGMWFAGMVLYGIGADRLGHLGPSIGWAILISSIVIIANVWGLLTGEWRGAGQKSLRVMITGIAILFIAIFAIGFSNG